MPTILRRIAGFYGVFGLFKLGKRNNNFEHYYNGLKDQVGRFESGDSKRNRDQKLRVYVAGACWEDLHQDEIRTYANLAHGGFLTP